MQVFSDRYKKVIKFKRSYNNVSFYSSDYTKRIDENFNEIVKGKDTEGNQYTAIGTVSRLSSERSPRILHIRNIKLI